MTGNEIKQISQSPISDVGIRTMESDINAISESGGDLTSLQLFRVPKEKIEIAEDVKIKLGVPGYAGPEQSVFASKGEIKGEKNVNPIIKIFFLILGVAIVVAGIGFLAYYLTSKFLK